ncbi:MAG: DMT family transporter [Anaerolineales bacterium]
MKLSHWLLFFGLGLAWGSSFLWIKLALGEVGPFNLVGWRLLFAILALLLVVSIMRPPLPKDRRIWGALFILGVINTALPFWLITWAEQHIDSAVASVINSSVPLFTMLIANFVLTDDRLTVQRVIGLLVGFGGILLLFSRELGSAQATLIGQAAALLGAIFYALSAVFIRRTLKGVSPMVQALVPLFSAETLIVSVALLREGVQVPQQPITWLALIWLGVVGSCIAYLLYYRLMHQIGPTRTTLVTYLFPVFGIVLGAIFLAEPVDAYLLGGSALILVSVAIVNRS